jgi:hypothetical protein
LIDEINGFKWYGLRRYIQTFAWCVKNSSISINDWTCISGYKPLKKFIWTNKWAYRYYSI